MSDDPFSDVLSFVNAQSVLSGGFTLGGAWAVRFPPPSKVKFFTLVKGACWIAMDGEETLLRLGEGDVFLVAAPRSFVFATDLRAKPVEARQVLAIGADGIARLGDGEDLFVLCGHVDLDPARGGLLLDVLPPSIHVRATAPEASTLQWLLAQLVRERVVDRPGAILASAQIAQLMFVQILRAYLAASGPLGAGWLRALGDERIARALRLMHADPGRSWQLGELAQAAAMSRSTFALRFKAVAGVAPLAYLTEWRMRLAERALRDGDIRVATLARSLGYTSESAFSNAFKRVTGNAPKRFRIAARGSGSNGEASRLESGDHLLRTRQADVVKSLP